MSRSSIMFGKYLLLFLSSIPLMFAREALGTTEATLEQDFQEGLRLREAGEYEAAISKFQGVLSSEPTLGRARAELVVSYFSALNFSAAREEAEHLLADASTPDLVKMNMRYFLEEMNKQSKTHIFTPYISFGIGHDDNINAGPSASTINLGGGQIGQLASGASPITRNFNTLNIGLAHRYLSQVPSIIFGRSAAYLWQSNISYYTNDYFSSGDFDLDVLSFTTGPLAVVAQRWRMGLDFTYDYVRLGNDKLVDIYGVTPQVTWNIKKNTDLTLSAKFQKRAFNDSKAIGRDSDYQSISLSLGTVLIDSDFTLQVGTSLFNESADVKRFTNDGYQFSSGVNWRIASNDNLYIKDVYKINKFAGEEPLFNKSRDESENRATLGFNHRFVEKYVKDWTMDANITYTENDSNVSVYEYRRAQFSLTFNKIF